MCGRRRPGRALAGLLAALVATPANADDIAVERALKATFLVRFGAYVAWPSEAFATLNGAVNICIVGDDPFGALIDDAIAGEQVDGRRLRVVRLQAISSDSECHIAYFAGSTSQSTSDALAAVEDAPVLTVTDAEFESSARGAIHFVVEDDRVRFHIDEAAAAKSDLALSSRLLGVALSVQRRSAP